MSCPLPGSDEDQSELQGDAPANWHPQHFVVIQSAGSGRITWLHGSHGVLYNTPEATLEIG